MLPACYSCVLCTKLSFQDGQFSFSLFALPLFPSIAECQSCLLPSFTSHLKEVTDFGIGALSPAFIFALFQFRCAMKGKFLARESSRSIHLQISVYVLSAPLHWSGCHHHAQPSFSTTPCRQPTSLITSLDHLACFLPRLSFNFQAGTYTLHLTEPQNTDCLCSLTFSSSMAMPPSAVSTVNKGYFLYKNNLPITNRTKSHTHQLPRAKIQQSRK